MAIVWSVPVVAAAVAAGLVLARARALEDAGMALAREVARLRQLRGPLADLRARADDTDARVLAFRARHPVSPADGGPGPGDRDGRPAPPGGPDVPDP